MKAVDDWDDLRFFLAIARSGSLAAAARSLGVDQSTVSRHLTALEDALGARLFERQADGLHISEAGQAIRDYAERAEELIAGLGTLADAAAEDSGPIHIETSPIFAQYFLIPRLRRITERCSGFALTVTTSRQMVNIQRHEADVALRQLPASYAPGSSSVIAQKVGEFPFAPYASQGYLEARGFDGEVERLASCQLVPLQAPSGNTLGREWMDSLGEAAKIALRARDLVVVVAAVQADLAIGIMPCMVANAIGNLRRVGPVVERYVQWVVTPMEARRSPRVRAVKEALVELIREDQRVFEPLG